jgi:Leucine-rich repeat (LRR) protein
LPADSLSVCDRTPQIRDYLVQQAGKPCEAINDADLLQITAVRIPGAGITTLQPGDFAGLARVETVNLKRNAITELPAGIFAGLTSLRVLVLLGNDIHRLPDDFAAGNVALEKIHIFQNAFTTIPDPVLKTLKALPKLNVLEIGRELDEESKDRLRDAFPRENEHVTLIFT